MKINLFVPYFEPKDRARANELKMCLEKNRECYAINHIYLMVDDGAGVDLEDGRVTVLDFDHRPTYLDWVTLSYQHCRSGISVLANADIYFDDTVRKLVELFNFDPTAFVALSRHELQNGSTHLHPNPHWSQDVWSFRPETAANKSRDANLNFPLGVPRCDNKISYVFGVYGHNVYNPCHDIKTVHAHETGLRNYSKKGDRRIVGGMAMVHASSSLLEPARLDIEMWPVNTNQFEKVRLNTTLEKWANQEGRAATPEIEDLPNLSSAKAQSARIVDDLLAKARKAAPQVTVPPSRTTPQDSAPAKADHESYRGDGRIEEPGILGFDDYWQFPAITERHSFHQIKRLAPRQNKVAYIGFPWATLIDVQNHNKNDKARLETLETELEWVAKKAKKYDRVLTVCQHIHMLKFQELFERAGVTDIFWSHATINNTQLPEHPKIALHPYPLYPVQQIEGPEIPIESRDHLFSFVGAKANKIYLTESRNHLIEELAGDPRGLVVERQTWHYNKVVYDAQILGKSKIDDKLVDNAASDQFKEVMRQTKFALCPSGTGPNSIRLWEAVVSGSIPVVLSDTYRPPANQSLWNQATVHCVEEREAIRGLPDRLEAIAANPVELQCRRAALQILALRYGRHNFVADVLDQYKSTAHARSDGISTA